MIKYIVNEEKRTVVAILESDGDDILSGSAIDYFIKRNSLARTLEGNVTSIHMRGEKCAYSFYETGLIPSVYRGVAKCDPRDIFDVEVGKRIAREKAYRLYKREFTRALKRMYLIAVKEVSSLGFITLNFAEKNDATDILENNFFIPFLI